MRFEFILSAVTALAATTAAAGPVSKSSGNDVGGRTFVAHFCEREDFEGTCYTYEMKDIGFHECVDLAPEKARKISSLRSGGSCLYFFGASGCAHESRLFKAPPHTTLRSLAAGHNDRIVSFTHIPKCLRECPGAGV